MEVSENDLGNIPKEKGNYILLLQLKKGSTISVGSLGSHHFQRGRYAYMGSALGPGGIRARILHHLNPSPKPHWHIDYLKPYLNWLAVGWKITNVRLECEWTQTLSALEGFRIPAPRFGASDCRQGCNAHLVQVPDGHANPFERLIIDEGHIDFMYNKTNL